MSSSVLIYKDKENHIRTEVILDNEMVWLSQLQMVDLFKKTKQNISLHINNIFKEGELSKDSVVKDSLTTASDGKQYKTALYSLDVIISVGYRVKSKQGTSFRIWANKILKEFLLQGYSIDRERLKTQKKQLLELENTIAVFKKAQLAPLMDSEAKGLLTVLTDYTRTFVLLGQYDSDNFPQDLLTRKASCEIKYLSAIDEIEKLKKQLIKINQATELFG